MNGPLEEGIVMVRLLHICTWESFLISVLKIRVDFSKDGGQALILRNKGGKKN